MVAALYSACVCVHMHNVMYVSCVQVVSKDAHGGSAVQCVCVSMEGSRVVTGGQDRYACAYICVCMYICMYVYVYNCDW